MKFHFTKLLQNSGWLSDVIVKTDSEGKILSISPDQPKTDCDEIVDGFALPGFQNSHSHAFQYAIAGLAENHSGINSADDFWSWRNVMYKLALSLSPEQLEAIAAMLYAEMLRHGYTNVAEFHYLHHDTYGQPYMNKAEMGERLISAAKRTGINITLIPIFYQKGGFDKPPEENQRRFISKNFHEYAELFETSKKACESYCGANIGVGVHSLRATEPTVIRDIAHSFPKDIPFHIHIAEQQQEIVDCVSHLKKRPVEWMLDNINLSKRFHFVHATHISEHETYGLADMNVNVALCPTTEGNLGDGIFPLAKFQENGGQWSIGTDSHVSLNPFEELRLLDYGQRLTTYRRNTFASADQGNSGMYAIKQTTIAGRRAMNNFESEYFKVGESFDACVISGNHPLIQTSSTDSLLNTIIYSSDETIQEGTIVKGEWKAKHGKHIHHLELVEDFVEALKELGVR